MRKKTHEIVLRPWLILKNLHLMFSLAICVQNRVDTMRVRLSGGEDKRIVRDSDSSAAKS
jgi:hypothetical protein